MDEQPKQGAVTLLLHEASNGNVEALNRLLPMVYDELRILARSRLRLERQGHTLNATALVHEAYVRLAGQERVEWQSRSHFFAIAAQSMRRILMNYAEARNAKKRSGNSPHVSLSEAQESDAEFFTADQASDLLELDHALERLAEFNPRGADVVQYRFFGGLSYEEIAEVLGVSVITVRRAWGAAKAWLRKELGDEISERTTTLLGPVDPGNRGNHA